MASLNLSTFGPSISKSYESVLSATQPPGISVQSALYAQWVVYSVSAPLANAFQQNLASQESVLKVQSTGDGDLTDMIDEFSDGKIQFALTKVKDPNTGLHKSILIAWCGDGVPERTKGYFTSHLATVAKTFQGYHVQMTVRSDRDLTPEAILKKVSDASGSRYEGESTSQKLINPIPVSSSTPVFTPTQGGSNKSSFNPMASSRAQDIQRQRNNIEDSDGWGADAPPISRTQLEKVPSSYQPTKIDFSEFKPSGGSEAQRPLHHPSNESSAQGDVVRGDYQPIGKVDIAAIRKQARDNESNDKPAPVRGAYEPVGKVDIAAIRARAQKPANQEQVSAGPGTGSLASSDAVERAESRQVSSERITNLPKPKIANRFGSSAEAFSGTKAPNPGGFGFNPNAMSTSQPVGVRRTFADQESKTPAQIWAEKRGNEPNPPSKGPVSSDTIPTPESAGWKSGYSGKSWAPVQISKPARAAEEGADVAAEQHNLGPDDSGTVASSGSHLQETSKSILPGSNEYSVQPQPPALDVSNKPNAGKGAAMLSTDMNNPSAAGHTVVPTLEDPQEPHTQAADAVPPIPAENNFAGDATERTFDEAASEEHQRDETHAMGTGTAHVPVVVPAGESVPIAASPLGTRGAERAIAQFDYEKAEDNEVELKEGEVITNIDKVDDNWWMGTNEKGESGLFPSNFVALVNQDEPEVATESQPPAPQSKERVSMGTAMYDYEAAEDNELSFPENAKIVAIEFPDEDWWSGEYGGKNGLFPANYVKLDD